MQSSKLEASEFKTMLTNALREAIDPKDLPSDPKELKKLARQVVDECIKSQNTKATDIKEVL